MSKNIPKGDSIMIDIEKIFSTKKEDGYIEVNKWRDNHSRSQRG